MCQRMADVEPDADAVDRKCERAVRFAKAYIDEHYELFETLAQE